MAEQLKPGDVVTADDDSIYIVKDTFTRENMGVICQCVHLDTIIEMYPPWKNYENKALPVGALEKITELPNDQT